ncbi:MAG: hypothetical protein ACQETB_04660 [Halobacteriota archaeon]
MAHGHSDEETGSTTLNRRRYLAFTGAAALGAFGASSAGSAAAAPGGYDGPNTEPWPEALWTYPEPNVDSTINLNDEGLAPGDTIDDYLNDAMDDNTRIEIEPGTYRHEGSTFRGSYEDLAIVGLGEPGDVVFEYPEPGWDSRPASIRSTGGGTLLIKNITLKGTISNDDHKFRIEASSSSEIVLEHVWMPDGQVDYPQNTRSSASGGIYAPSSDHAGTLRLLWCHVEGFGDNGAYIDGWAGSGNGQAIVVGGLYRNNNIANVRIGNDNSIIYRATCVHDESPNLASNRLRNQRNIRVRQPGDGLIIDDCDVYHAVSSWKPVALHSGADGGSGSISNTRIYTESSSEAISGYGGVDSDWTAENVHVTGSGDLDTDISIEGTSCTGSDCDVADVEPWWGVEDRDSEPSTSPEAPPDRAADEIDFFEVSNVLEPYSVAHGTPFAWRNDQERTAPDSEQSLRCDGQGRSCGIESFPGDGLETYPQRGEEFEFWFRQDARDESVQSRFRFFLESVDDDLFGYSIRLTNGRIELREFVDSEPGSVLSDDDIAYPTEAFNRVHVQSDETSIQVTVSDDDGSELGTVTVDDDRFSGQGIRYWIPSAMDSEHSTWLDNVRALSTESADSDSNGSDSTRDDEDPSTDGDRSDEPGDSDGDSSGSDESSDGGNSGSDESSDGGSSGSDESSDGGNSVPDESVPGFGVLATLGGAIGFGGYLLKRATDSETSEDA